MTCDLSRAGRGSTLRLLRVCDGPPRYGLAPLKPLSPRLSAEVRDWVNELREAWVAAGLSMNQFASVHSVDKGTASRYLNGECVLADRWFLDKLLAVLADSGKPVTGEVREHLTSLSPSTTRPE